MDLLQEYFNRDLNADESDQLGNILASSPEESERFAKAMEKHYASLGLPRPVWKPKPFISKNLGWQSALRNLRAIPTDMAGWVKLSIAIVALGATVISYKIYGEHQLPARPVNLTVPAQAPVPAPPRYQQLSVTVELPKPGLVTVKVCDEGKTDLKTLYAGILPAGKKVFIWNGKKEDGTTAAPGTYFIRVQSGRSRMSREVHLKGD